VVNGYVDLLNFEATLIASVAFFVFRLNKGGGMRAKLMPAVLILPVLFLTGCASIVGKSDFPLTINSNPDGANILIKDERGLKVFSGITPTTVTLTAGEAYFHGKSYNITFSKSGYADQYVEVKSTLSGWYFGNILFGGLIGILIVDPVTGKMWKLPVTDVTGNLYEKTASNKNQQVLQIVSIDQIPKEDRVKLVKLN